MAVELEKKLDCKDLYSYLTNLGTPSLDSLYDSSHACLAVFRELPEQAKQYVMRMLLLEGSISTSLLASWATGAGQSEHQKSLMKLQNLRIMINNMSDEVTVNPVFRSSIKLFHTSGSSAVEPLPPDKHAKDINFLTKYADGRWECLLHYLVDSSTQEVSSGMQDLMKNSKLVFHKSSDGRSVTTISSLGFQFLLLSRRTQVWFIVQEYLKNSQSLGLECVECLKLLFQLSFLQSGKDYSTELLTPTQLVFLQDLRELGLVYQRKRASGRYSPTHLGINVLEGSKRSDEEGSMIPTIIKDGYIIVETNFRLCAYTNSQLDIQIIGLFCQLQYKFPNMVIGTITRESTHNAFKSGIKAEQIFSFLESHAHPNALQNSPVIPATVRDQVTLWQQERDRLSFTEGVLYNQFITQNDFELVRKYAEDLGVLLWSSGTSRSMVVSKGGHEEVRRFWKRNKQN